VKNCRWVMGVACALFLAACSKQIVEIRTLPEASNRVLFGAGQLQATLNQAGYRTVMQQNVQQDDATLSDSKVRRILLTEVNDTTLKKEGFRIKTSGNVTKVSGRDGSGVLYGCRELIDRIKDSSGKLDFPEELTDAPEMVLRGTCVGLQKTAYLPGHNVYEYPYTPENFPWFYDKAQWIKCLDMMVENRMNTLYLWNGHPFASLVRLKDYPFAVEVDDATFKKNEEIFSFLTKEADKRGIYVIQMFYNIIVSKPFAEHYGIKTQDRHRPITPLISDYTRKSIAAFIEEYPNVGLLVCLGEAMNTYEDDVEWFTKTIIPGVKDGLKALGRTDEPPIMLRAHDTDCKMVISAALPLYKNLYTMNKYNGESLTTYQPRGPWAETHRELSELGSVHISNVHILANLEPFRWGAPYFIQRSVQAMHQVHGANALHLYPQASYWDWPYTADKLKDGQREYQLDRNWIWYKAWARYAWNCHRDRQEEVSYWDKQLGDYYGTDTATAESIQNAYEESGEIAPKLLRRFGITEGNRQTLLLGMFMSQLVNPYKYTIYPGFYESCGPEGEKLIEYVEKEWKKQLHVGELPLDIIAQVIAHGDKAVAAIDAAEGKIGKNRDEFERLRNDMHCYREFAYCFNLKVKAAKLVLDYQWGKNMKDLYAALPLMEESLNHYRKLVDLTKDHYFYANSMQTAQRRIPIGGDDGKNKTWAEMLPYYEKELENFKTNLALLEDRQKGKATMTNAKISPLSAVSVNLSNPIGKVKLTTGARLFSDLPDQKVEALAPELEGLSALYLNGDEQRHRGTVLNFKSAQPVKLLVGYFRDYQKKYAAAPKLETDASANDYGQAEAVLSNAVRITGMPLVDVHVYHFPAGKHKLLLPKGYLLVLGFTGQEITPRNGGLAGDEQSIDWMFY